MFANTFPKNLQFYPADVSESPDDAKKTARPAVDIQVVMRAMFVKPHCLEFPYEDTKGNEMMWRVHGVNVHLLESRILDGRIFRFKIGAVIETETIKAEGKTDVHVDKPAVGLEDVQIVEIKQIQQCTSDSKYHPYGEPLAPLTVPAPDWLWCLDTGHARYWFHWIDLERFATSRKFGSKDHLLLFRGRHSFIFTPLFKADTGGYDTFEHILSNNFAENTTNYLCPESFEHVIGSDSEEGSVPETRLIIQTTSYFPKDFDRYRVAKVKHKLGDVSNDAEWNMVYANPDAEARRRAKKMAQQIPRSVDM